MSVSDLDSDDLNIIVESNNTAILNVTPNWTNTLNQASYDGVVLDFNLTTPPKVSGLARVSVTVNDGDENSTKSFDVNVRGVRSISHTY